MYKLFDVFFFNGGCFFYYCHSANIIPTSILLQTHAYVNVIRVNLELYMYGWPFWPKQPRYFGRYSIKYEQWIHYDYLMCLLSTYYYPANHMDFKCSIFRTMERRWQPK